MNKIVRNAALSLAVCLLPGHGAIAEQPAVKAAIQNVKERKPAAQFRLPDARNKAVSLSAFRGKVVLVNFWATECGGCRIEIPYFEEFDRKYRSSGFEAVGLSMDVAYEGLKGPAEAWERVNPFVRQHGLTFPVLLADDAVEKAYKVESLPSTYLLDRKGRVAATYIGLVDKTDVERNIRTLVAERWTGSPSHR